MGCPQIGRQPFAVRPCAGPAVVGEEPWHASAVEVREERLQPPAGEALVVAGVGAFRGALPRRVEVDEVVGTGRRQALDRVTGDGDRPRAEQVPAALDLARRLLD